MIKEIIQPSMILISCNTHLTETTLIAIPRNCSTITFRNAYVSGALLQSATASNVFRPGNQVYANGDITFRDSPYFHCHVGIQSRLSPNPILYVSQFMTSGNGNVGVAVRLEFYIQ